MPEGWRTVRVFISSTFKDMQAERDHLVRFVFPRLREEFLERRLHLVDVDLRWGVTSDQDAFELCMDEIDRCRPRFLGLLGGRYGWVPPPKVVEAGLMDRLRAGLSPAGELSADEQAILENLYASEEGAAAYRLRDKPQRRDEVAPWEAESAIAVDIFRRAGLPATRFSITASEIHYAALDRLDHPGFHYFYFRDPAVTDSILEPHASDYREPKDSPAEEALKALKQRIVDARLPLYEYPCTWDRAVARIAHLEAFGARVYADLRSSVDAEFGTAPPAPLDEFAEESTAIEAFVEARVERYVVGTRRPVFQMLYTHTEGAGGNGYLCVVGDPGSGKSALLGKFCRDYVNGTEDHPAHRDQIVIPHFVGASTASTNIRQVLRRFCHELAEGANLADEIPDDYDKLREAFAAFLEEAAAVKHVVILIDAINQFDPTFQAPAMRWLPDSLPANARVLLTAVPGPALRTLRARREPPAEVLLPGLERSDATAIIDGSLARYRKTLDATQRAELLAKQDAGSPLYLLTALEELRTLGTYEEITRRIRELPGQAQPLFGWVLERLERDPGFRDGQGRLVGEDLVRRYAGYVAVGRSGMAHAELVELIAPDDIQGNLAALQRLLRPYLMYRGQMLDFFHTQLRQAVQGKYLAGAEQARNAHRTVAGYFRRKADPAGDSTWTGDYPRALSELPYHLTQAEMWDEVYNILTDFAFLEAKCTYVAVVTAGKRPDARRTYGGIYELQEDYRRALERFPLEMPENAHYRESGVE